MKGKLDAEVASTYLLGASGKDRPNTPYRVVQAEEVPKLTPEQIQAVRSSGRKCGKCSRTTSKPL